MEIWLYILWDYILVRDEEKYIIMNDNPADNT